MLSAITLCAVIAISPPVAPSKIPRVRPMTDAARQMVEDASRRSPTVARLIEFIEQQTDAIVYVDLQFALPTDGLTSIVTANDQCRFLRVAIGRTLGIYRRIEILGHELQHAVEIIQARGVRDGSDLRRLFANIGWLLTDRTFESGEAIDVERQVRRELRSGINPQSRKRG
jgi:hypothetical protein